MKLIIELPNGFMNTAVTVSNRFIADTNDSFKWNTLSFPLPAGKWNIYNIEGRKVTLISTVLRACKSLK